MVPRDSCDQPATRNRARHTHKREILARIIFPFFSVKSKFKENLALQGTPPGGPASSFATRQNFERRKPVPTAPIGPVLAHNRATAFCRRRPRPPISRLNRFNPKSTRCRCQEEFSYFALKFCFLGRGKLPPAGKHTEARSSLRTSQTGLQNAGSDPAPTRFPDLEFRLQADGYPFARRDLAVQASDKKFRSLEPDLVRGLRHSRQVRPEKLRKRNVVEGCDRDVGGTVQPHLFQGLHGAHRHHAIGDKQRTGAPVLQ